MSTLIGVGSRVEDVSTRALHFDGQTAAPRLVKLRFDDTAQALIEDGAGDLCWPFSAMRRLADQAGAGQIVLRLEGDATQRLLIRDPQAIRLIEARTPDLDRAPKVPGLWRLWAWGGAAIASVALILFVLVPAMSDQLAEFLPPEGERALGEATFDQIRTTLDDTGIGGLRVCEGPGGLAALAKIETRLTGTADLPTDLTIHVLDHPIVNAFALPGGIVVFFDGLLQEAGTPDEIAAVFAHEVGHVAARDPTRIALRSAGSIGVLGLLLGDFAGGAAVLFLTDRVIQADYTQEVEAAADLYAHEMLLAANLPPSAIATLFERLAADGGEPPDIVQHFLSHPAMGDRIAAAEAATPKGASFAPVLTEDEWQALRAICD